MKTGYDPVARQWPGWIAAAGLNARYLPSVVPAGTRVATITADAAAQFDLPDAIRPSSPAPPMAARPSWRAAPPQPGDGVTSLGTTLTSKLLSSAPVFAPQYGIYSHRIGDTWLAGGASNAGGQAIMAHFSRDEIERLTPLIDPDTPTGLDYYPLARPGERFPINDPTLAPRFEPRPAEPQRFLQAMLEGIASIEALGYRRLAELGATPLATIRTVGGGAANETWTKIRLKALGVPATSCREHPCLRWRGPTGLAWYRCRRLEHLGAIAARFGGMLIDQFGVIHDGEKLYPGVVDTLENLKRAQIPVVVMTNSGKRADANSQPPCRHGSRSLSLRRCDEFGRGRLPVSMLRPRRAAPISSAAMARIMASTISSLSPIRATRKTSADPRLQCTKDIA